MWSEFHFLRPAWLLMLLPLAALLWQRWRRGGDAAAWRDVVDAHLLPHLLSGDRGRRAGLPWALLLLGGVLLIVALAGPTWQRLPEPLYQAPQYRIIALDLSPSMNATDLRPSRLARARFEVLDLLRDASDAQTALIAYGAEPYVVSPLTSDADTIAAQVPLLETALLPVVGPRRTDLALRSAGELLRQAGVPRGDVILITDDAGNPEPAAAAAAALVDDGYRVSVLAVGTPHGAPVRLHDGTLLKDAAGAIVVPRLDTPALAALTQAGGGIYVHAALGERDTVRLLSGAASPHGDAVESDDASGEAWRDQGPWLLLLLLPLAALAFRRGWLSPLPIVLLCVLPSTDAYALTWDDLWLRADQQAMRQLEAGRPAQAATLFTDRDWRAAAAYRAGDYAGALELLSDDNAYNRGNALAHLGQFEEAVSAYDEALRQDPADADARHNREVLQRLLERHAEAERQARQQDETSPESSPDTPSESATQQAQTGEAQQDDNSDQGSDAGEQRQQQQDAEQDSETGQEASSDSTETAEQGDPQPGDEQQGGASADLQSARPGAAGDREGQTSQAAGDSRDDTGEGDAGTDDRRGKHDAPDVAGDAADDAEQRAETPTGDDAEEVAADSDGVPQATADETAESTAAQHDRVGEAASPDPRGETGAERDADQAEMDGIADAGEAAPGTAEAHDGKAAGDRPDNAVEAVTASNTGVQDRPNGTRQGESGDMGRMPADLPPSPRGAPSTLTKRPGLGDLLGGDVGRGPGTATSRELAGADGEDAQALEQMLRQVDDDPGGLLRQRFLLQHLRRSGRLP